jgi:hypothetical protein
MTTKRTTRSRKKAVEPADPSTTVTPTSSEAIGATPAAPPPGGPLGDELTELVLRFARRFPNRTVDLGPLAEELGTDPFTLQLHLERMGRRRLIVLPFVEPGTAGGATLTEKGLRWLIAREGGKPRDVPDAVKKAQDHVRAGDEAARLPRAQVYGVRTPAS